MFTVEERKQIDNIINLGFVDTFREFNKEGEHYTWWPYRVDARQRNLGWRLDYMFMSNILLPQLTNAYILRDVEGSDHCPVGIEIVV
jgi:exodeoxyribonuclease-3